MRAACPELEETRAACLYTAQLELGAHFGLKDARAACLLYSVGRQHGRAVIRCYGNVICYD